MGKAKKKAWKKIPRTADEELPEIQEQQRLETLEDKDIFEIDDEPVVNKKLSVKQKRLQQHQERLSKLEDLKDVKKSVKLISKRVPIKLPSKLERTKNPRPPKKEPKGVQPNLMKDPWADEDSQVGDENDFIVKGKTHDLKERKQVKVKAPKTRNHIPSVLPAIKVADPGASYNPELSEYVDYANKLAGDEIELQKAEKKLARQLASKRPKVTEAERQAELEEGLFEESTDEDEDMKDEDLKEVVLKPKQPKAKSIKQKKRELQRKIAELERKNEKEMSKREREQINNLKKLSKIIDVKIKESQEKAAERAGTKLLNNVTQRKKLGRGKFEKYEEPVALPSELKGSLRLAKTEGSLMTEHFKSLQARNMLPIGGSKETKKLPKRLKRKFTEKRSVKDVTETTKPR